MPYSKEELLNDALRSALKIWKKFTHNIEALIARTPEPTRFEKWQEVAEVVTLLGLLHDKWVEFQADVDNNNADAMTAAKARVLESFLTPVGKVLDKYNKTERTNPAPPDVDLEKIELEELHKVITKIHELTPNPCPDALRQARNKKKDFALFAVKALPFLGFFMLPVAGIFVACITGIAGLMAAPSVRTKYHLDDPRPDSQRLVETLGVKLGQVKHILANRLRQNSVKLKAS